MSKNKYDALQESFDYSDIEVTVYCADAGLWEVPEGKELTTNTWNNTTHYLDGEPWCIEAYLAHDSAARNWRVENVAREMQREGWSFKAGVWRCPHCTKRGE